MTAKKTALSAILCASMVLPVLASDLDIVPSQETLNSLHEAQGGSPEMYRQAKEALKGYDEADQYSNRKQADSLNLMLKMDRLIVSEEIQITPDFVTSVTFIDGAGNPWPIKFARVGNAKKFIVEVGDGNGSGEIDPSVAHIAAITSPYMAGRSNAKLYFEGIHKPVQITLVARRDSYHEDVVLKFPIENPAAPESNKLSTGYLMDNRVAVIDDPYARGLADNVSAQDLVGAVEMNIEITDIHERPVQEKMSRAIKVGPLIYVKAPLHGVVPSPAGITKGIHGYSVFKFRDSPRLVSGIDKHGRVIMVKIKELDGEYGLRHLPISGRLK